MSEGWILIYVNRSGGRFDGKVEMPRVDAEREALRIQDDEFQVVGIKNAETKEFVPFHRLVV